MTINFKESNAGNFKRGRDVPIQYIVIHYTANKGDTAKNNADYFAREYVGASANYFVDEKDVWNSVKDTDTAWHCGGGLQGSGGASFYGRCKNANSIGIEICMNDKAGNVRQGSIDTAAELTRFLMAKYNVPIDRVIRHYDITSKLCPRPMVDDITLWNAFKAALVAEQEEEMKVYSYVKDMPTWAQDSVTKAIKKGIVAMDASGAVSIYEANLQTLVWMDRAHMFD